MSLLNNEARAVLDLCLAKESPDMRGRVEEIIHKSQLNASDPLFLILALTGQMRVFLEDAPKEMSQQLQAWKSQNQDGMAEISRAMELLQENQELQTQKIKQGIEEVNSEFCQDIQAKNLESIQGVSDLVSQVEGLKIQLEEMNITLQKERANNIKVMRALIEGLTKTTDDLVFVNDKIDRSLNFLKKKIFNRWVIGGSIISVSYTHLTLPTIYSV